MKSYDISHIPAPVHEAILHLMEVLVEAFPPSTEPPDPLHAPAERAVTRTSAPVAAPVLPPPHRLPEGMQDTPRAALLATPRPLSCPHGTDEVPCCPACTTVARAEAIVVDVESAEQQRWPRSALELRVLEALRTWHPMPISPKQMAAQLNIDPLDARRLLQGLAVLGTIEHAGYGHYRHKDPSMPLAVPVAPRRQTRHTDAAAGSEEEDLNSLVKLMARLHGAYPAPVSVEEMTHTLRLPNAPLLFHIATALGFAEQVAHGVYKYRPEVA